MSPGAAEDTALLDAFALEDSVAKAGEEPKTQSRLKQYEEGQDVVSLKPVSSLVPEVGTARGMWV